MCVCVFNLCDLVVENLSSLTLIATFPGFIVTITELTITELTRSKRVDSVLEFYA